jgi:hypothetical protein
VIVTPDGLGEIDRTVRHLAAQTARDQIELVIVAPSLEGGKIDGDAPPLDRFQSVRLVEVGPITATGSAFAAGVRAASAPVVACAEEHSFPEPGWAAALIAAHAGPWCAVGGVLRNANPATGTSWSHLYTDFGPAVFPAAAGEAAELPGHHTAYKRDALLAYGPVLDRMLEVEWVLQDDLRARGERLFLEPRAVSWHLNVSRLASQLRSEYQGGRAFGGNRARLRGWSPLRRLLYIGAGPLLPPLRLKRAIRDLRRSNPHLLPGVLPALMSGLVANSIGQVVGYAFGRGHAPRRRISIELRRDRHLTARERAQLAAIPPGEPPRLAATDGDRSKRIGAPRTLKSTSVEQPRRKHGNITL